jgi:predicted small lipoprotein YifL
MSCNSANLAKAALIALTAMLAACAPRGPTNMQPADPARYNADLAMCQQQAASSFSFGNAVTECMQARGYHVM